MCLGKHLPGIAVSFLDIEATLIGPGEPRSSGIRMVLQFEDIVVKTVQLRRK
jgi:hypothetical protein